MVRPAIVTPNCSLRMGGEAALPFHFFRVLRARGVDVQLVTHARNRAELEEAWPGETDRIHYAADDWLHRLLYRLCTALPERVARATFGIAAEFHTERQQRRILRKLVREGRINLIHRPIPVSPVQPSLIHGLGVPVVFGPLNGGMDYPPGFRRSENPLERLAVRLGRAAGGLVNLLFPGKRRAAAILVANRRSHEVLPRGVRSGRVIELPENGVDLPLWQSHATGPGGEAEGPVRFVFLGRLVDWKAVDLLLEAWAEGRQRGLGAAVLEIIGDGPMMAPLKRRRDALGLGDDVEFSGWQPQAEAARRLARSGALVLPSLLECGGAVVLEAMAAGLPVVAAKWGGPTDYLTDECGILIEPRDHASFVAGFADAIVRLAESPELRQRMGAAGRERVAQHYDWDRKGALMLEIYASALGRRDEWAATHDGRNADSRVPVPAGTAAGGGVD